MWQGHLRDSRQSLCSHQHRSNSVWGTVLRQHILAGNQPRLWSRRQQEQCYARGPAFPAIPREDSLSKVGHTSASRDFCRGDRLKEKRLWGESGRVH